MLSYVTSARMSLQWGRGHVTAESNRHNAEQWNERGSLQWGRGHVTAESKRYAEYMTSKKKLQWGRGHVTAERSLPPSATNVLPSASMGPRSCDRGEMRGVFSSAIAPCRFNGAAVM